MMMFEKAASQSDRNPHGLNTSASTIPSSSSNTSGTDSSDYSLRDINSMVESREELNWSSDPTQNREELDPDAPIITRFARDSEILNQSEGAVHVYPEQWGDTEVDIIRTLGKGSYGTVSMGMDPNTGKLMAVKTLQIGPNFDQDTFKKEMAYMKHLDHPNIVKFLGISGTSTSVSICMELAGGNSLQSMMEDSNSYFPSSRGPCAFGEELIQKWTKQLLNALVHMHIMDVAHLDLKPGNILLDGGGQLKIVDFGISMVITPDEDSSRTNVRAGTLQYMPPESHQGVYSKKSDIWSLGATLLHLVSGVLPWAGPLMARDRLMSFFNNEDPDPAALFSGPLSAFPIPDFPRHKLSRNAIDFLEQCFTRDFVQRPSAAELLQHPFITEPYTGETASQDDARYQENLNRYNQRLAEEAAERERERVAFANSNRQNFATPLEESGLNDIPSPSQNLRTRIRIRKLNDFAVYMQLRTAQVAMRSNHHRQLMMIPFLI